MSVSDTIARRTPDWRALEDDVAWLRSTPRRGLDPASLELIQRLAPQRVLYSSCSPQTLARDLQLLSGQFQPIWMQGFDMFPLTEHFEVLCELELTVGKS